MKADTHIAPFFAKSITPASGLNHLGLRNAAEGNTAQGKSVLGTKSKNSGANLFMRLNYWSVYCCSNIMETPPTLTGLEALAAATVSFSVL